MIVKEIKKQIIENFNENEVEFYKDGKGKIYEISLVVNADDEKEVTISEVTEFFKGNVYNVPDAVSYDTSVELADDMEIEKIKIEYNYNR